MAWISGRTLSPKSSELVFWISENATFPGTQDWVQFWQVCSGLEPFVEGFQFSDRLLEITSRDYDDFAIRLDPCQYIRGWLGKEGKATEGAETDFDVMSECDSYDRTVTYVVDSWEIGDGDAVATTEGCIGSSCDEISIYLKVRGRNPSRTALDVALASDILRAICWQESRWRQFLPSGKPLFNQNANGTSDWGLMQINKATEEQRWNWKANVSRAAAILEEKRSYAKAYLDKHPGYTSEMLENEMIQRYNGGAYHKWDSETDMWIPNPPNKYVALIRQFLTDMPWRETALA